MKAAFYERYGDTNVLSIREVDVPVPSDDEVLVRIHAASINSWDWDMIRGKPWIVRMWGLFSPRHKIPGADIAGVVTAVGKNVSRFKPGDEVFGDLSENGWAGFAGYRAVNEKAVFSKPKGLSFEEAASIPQAGLMALQAIRDKGNLRAGQKFLMIGGGGGVGTFAIQLARNIGATTTAVDAASKHDLMRSLGASRVLDYHHDDFSKDPGRYDLIIDVVASKPLSVYRKCLNQGGRFLMIGGTMPAIFDAMLLGKVRSWNTERHLGILPYRTNVGIGELGDLCEQRKVIPVIDKTFPLDNIREAFQYYASGAVKGKVVIRVS
jgi:NADPH:quinone reductase-like Zn-dependent oxidoreductase